VLPEARISEALSIAQRLCDRVAARTFDVASLSLPVTASFGVCALDDPRGDVLVQSSAVPDRMVKAADDALYQSKRTGRNRVTSAPLRDRVSETASRAVPLQLDA
jgi:diguanylate cyclase (GGDEF)-like protein